MNKKIGVLIYFLSFIIIVPFLFYVINISTISTNSQSISLSQGKVIYDLPYPGILPDNPLYSLKMIRDRMVDIATRDNTKKAELYLLYSDKRFASAIILANKGKFSLAISSLSKGEKYFSKIPILVSEAKKQGVSPNQSFLYRLKLSNDKHKEIIEDITKQPPQGEEVQFRTILEMNKIIKEELNKL